MADASTSPDPASSAFAVEVSSALLAAARRRDAAALQALCGLFERPAYTLALRLCGRPEDAADVLQDSLLKALTRLHSYRGEAPFWPGCGRSW